LAVTLLGCEFNVELASVEFVSIKFEDCFVGCLFGPVLNKPHSSVCSSWSGQQPEANDLAAGREKHSEIALMSFIREIVDKYTTGK
jgi:hypothetical protein